MASPGSLARAASESTTCGLRRKRKQLAGLVAASANSACGGRLSSTNTSVTVIGRHFPARMKNGTPAQRQESSCSRTAAKVSTSESGATPGSFR